MAGELTATSAEIFFLDPPQVPEPRDKPGAEEEKGENKRLVKLKVRLHAPDMPAFETAADLPPPLPNFQ